VVDHRGRRVGTFIGLVDATGEEIAVRHDALFLWRRRALPVATVARVLPTHRVVVLNIDRRALKQAAVVPVAANAPSSADLDPLPAEDTETAGAGERSSADEDSSSDDWRARIAFYAARPESDRTATDGADELRRNASEHADAASRENTGSGAARHLLFVPTFHGYRLVEREGDAPVAADYVSLPEYSGLFRIAKLAASPFPNDRRTCVYLEQCESGDNAGVSS
jgi:hypothetical protein